MVRNTNNCLYVCGRTRIHDADRPPVAAGKKISAILYECSLGGIDSVITESLAQDTEKFRRHFSG
jgi:hypothetical protein